MEIIILFHLKKIRLRCSIWEDFIKLQADASYALKMMRNPDEWKDQNPNDKKED